jgi:hypothetical protein
LIHARHLRVRQRLIHLVSARLWQRAVLFRADGAYLADVRFGSKAEELTLSK